MSGLFVGGGMTRGTSITMVIVQPPVTGPSVWVVGMVVGVVAMMVGAVIEHDLRK